jgi:hypothetical protein
VGEFLEMLRRRELLPELRCVLASRAVLRASSTQEPPPFATQELPLNEFDSEAAVGYLASQGITDPQTAVALAAQVGGNPLSLKLAAEDYQKEGLSGLSEVGGGLRLFFAVDAAEIQGQLYRRILQHIADLEVRALAHPGLVLRRVTAEVIRKVLSGPCGVAVPDKARADDLFEKLAREVSLVTREGDVLTHRPDVRRVMLGQLRNDPEKRELVRAIHRAAVAYYKDFDDPAARAEEIYHRLSLGQKSDTIRARWDDRVGPLLASSLEELPPESRAFLATRLGVDVDAEARQQALLADWESNAARRADDLIRLNKPGEALAVLQERQERTPGSPLYLLEAAARDQLVEWEAATAVLNRGIASALGRGHDGAVLELLTLLGRILRRAGDTPGALEALRQADQLAKRRRDPVARLAVTLERLRAMQVQDQADRGEIESARQTALSLLGVGSLQSKLARQPGLLYGLAGTMGEAHPEVIHLAFRLAGVGAPSVLGRRILARALTTWDQIVSADRRAPEGVLLSQPDFARGGPEASWSWLAREAPLEVLSRGVISLMGANALPSPAARRFAEYARSLLTPEFVRPLQAALLDAFPTPRDLVNFARRGLGEGILDGPWPEGETLRAAVARLVEHFVESGRFEELVTRALTWAPKSQKIQALATAMDVPTVPRPTSGSWFGLGSGTPRWTAAMIDELVSALTDAFGVAGLHDVLRAVGETWLDAVTPGGRPEEIARDVVLWADARGRLDDLVAEALKVRPDHPALANVARSAGVKAAGASAFAPPALNKADRSDPAAIRLRPPTFMDVEAWRSRLQVLLATICRIEAGSPPSAFATGFLVGPRLVMTSGEILRARNSPVYFVFAEPSGFVFAEPSEFVVAGLSWRSERAYRMATVVPYERDQQLDVALLLVDGMPELNLLVGLPGARRWLPLMPVAPEDGELILVVQFEHPNPTTKLVIAGSSVGVDPTTGRFVHWANTVVGSWGSPCFTADWGLFGIHLGTDQEGLGHGQLLAPVADLLARRGVWFPAVPP